MNIEELQKMKRHLGEGGELEIVNASGETDTFLLEQLDINSLPALMAVYGELDKGSSFSDLSEEYQMKLVDLILTSVQLSYPKPKGMEDTDYIKLTSGFVTHNFMPLMLKMFDINEMGSKSMVKKDIDIIKERISNAGNAGDITKPEVKKTEVGGK